MDEHLEEDDDVETIGYTLPSNQLTEVFFSECDLWDYFDRLFKSKASPKSKKGPNINENFLLIAHRNPIPSQPK